MRFCRKIHGQDVIGRYALLVESKIEQVSRYQGQVHRTYYFCAEASDYNDFIEHVIVITLFLA